VIPLKGKRKPVMLVAAVVIRKTACHWPSHRPAPSAGRAAASPLRLEVADDIDAGYCR